jgi:hypothetical protein
VTFALHAFANTIAGLSAEDHAAQTSAAISEAVGGARVAVDGLGVLRLRVVSSQILTDDEADTFHAVINVRGRFLTG